MKGAGTAVGIGLATGAGTGVAAGYSDHDEAGHKEPVKVAGITTTWYPNSHADVQLGRMMQGYNLNGSMKGDNFHPHYPETADEPYLGVDPGEYGHSGDPLAPTELVSLYTDQIADEDLSRPLAKRYLVPIYDTVKEALTLGTGELAVDGVYLCIEHGDYPVNSLGVTEYPKRRLFEQVIQVFEESNEVVPVFVDKFLAANWNDASWIYQKAQEMDIPLMAGSSTPVSWRAPWQAGQSPTVESGAKIDQAVCMGYGGIVYGGYHGLELMQSLVENRAGDETGVEAVRALSGDAVWEAAETGVYDKRVPLAALSRQDSRDWVIDDWQELQERVDNPELGLIEYSDGLTGMVFGLPGVSSAWSAAWRYDEPGNPIKSTKADLQLARPYGHHGILVENVQKMFITGEPVYPAERTLLVNGVLLEVLKSLTSDSNPRIETPQLTISYQSEWEYVQHVPQPPNRSTDGDFPSNFPWHIPMSFEDAAEILEARAGYWSITTAQQKQLLTHLHTAWCMATSGKEEQAKEAMKRFISTGSSIDGDIAAIGENLLSHRLPLLIELTGGFLEATKQR